MRRIEGISRRRIWTGCALFAVVCALAYADGRVYRTIRSALHEKRVSSTALPSDEAVLFQWNAKDAVITAAQRAEVSIEDGAHRTGLLLSADQLRAGALEYAPFTNDVVFRLTAYDPDGTVGRTAVRVVDSLVAGTADRAAGPAAPGRAPGTITMRTLQNGTAQ